MVDVSPVASVVGARLWDILTVIPRAPLGAASGALDGYNVYKAGKAAITNPLATQGLGSVGLTVYNFLRNTIGNLFAGGLSGIKNSGILPAVGEAFKSLELKGLSGAFGKVGGRGLLLLGGHVGIAALAIIMGAKLAFSAWNKVSEIKKGYYPDVVRNPLVHGMQAAFGLATAIGGVTMLTPGGAALGLATTAVGFLGSVAMGLVKYAMGGFHWINRPNLAPYPLDRIFRGFRNPALYDTY